MYECYILRSVGSMKQTKYPPMWSSDCILLHIKDDCSIVVYAFRSCQSREVHFLQVCQKPQPMYRCIIIDLSYTICDLQIVEDVRYCSQRIRTSLLVTFVIKNAFFTGGTVSVQFVINIAFSLVEGTVTVRDVFDGVYVVLVGRNICGWLVVICRNCVFFSLGLNPKLSE